MTKTCIGQGWSGNHSRILVIHMENKILHYRKERNGVSCSYVKKKKSFETSNPVVPKVLIYHIKYVLLYFKVNKGIKKCDTVYKNFLESFVFVIFHSAI